MAGNDGIQVPDFEITKVDDKLKKYVRKIVIDYAQDGPDMFEVTFLNQSTEDHTTNPFTHASGKFTSKFKEGDEITISVGYKGGGGGMTKMITGEIVSTNAGFHDRNSATFVIRGYDKLHRLSRGRKQRTFLNMKDSDIAKKIAGEMGLSADVDDSGKAHDHVFQNNLSDIDFLYARARFIGFELDVEDDKLLFKKPKITQSGQLKADWKTDIKRVGFDMSTAHQVDEVQVRGWSVKEKKEIVGKAKSGDELSKMSGDKVGADFQKGKFGGGQRISVINNVPLESQEQADAIAKARFNELSMQTLTGNAEVQGNPELKTGKTMDFGDIGKKYEGTYYVVSAVHTIRIGDGPGTGYTTRFQFKRTGAKST